MFEGHIHSGAFSVFSMPFGPERNDCEEDVAPASDRLDPTRVLVAPAVPEQVGGAIPGGPCGSGAECETPMGTCSTKQANQPTRSTPSTSQSGYEMEIGANIGVAHGGDGLDGSVEALEPRDLGVDGLNYDTGDDGIAAADWLDVTHAMLDAVD